MFIIHGDLILSFIQVSLNNKHEIVQLVPPLLVTYVGGVEHVTINMLAQLWSDLSLE